MTTSKNIGFIKDLLFSLYLERIWYGQEVIVSLKNISFKGISIQIMMMLTAQTGKYLRGLTSELYLRLTKMLNF